MAERGGAVERSRSDGWERQRANGDAGRIGRPDVGRYGLCDCGWRVAALAAAGASDAAVASLMARLSEARADVQTGSSRSLIHPMTGGVVPHPQRPMVTAVYGGCILVCAAAALPAFKPTRDREHGLPYCQISVP